VDGWCGNVYARETAGDTKYHQKNTEDVLICLIKKNPVRGGVLTGSVGGGNEGKEVTSFRLAMYKANLVPIFKFRVKK